MKMITLPKIGLHGRICHICLMYILYSYLFDDKIGGYRKLLSQNHFDQIIISKFGWWEKGPEKIHYHEWFLFDCKQ